MPGPVVHTIIAEHLPDAFDERSGTGSTDIGDDVLRKHRNALVYGAQGPDPFFFNPNDWVGQPGVARLMTTWSNLRGSLAVTMYDLKEPLIELKREFKGNLDSTIEDISASETSDGSQIITEARNFLVLLREVLAVAGKIVGSFLKKLVLDGADPFGIYISPLQTCGQRKYTPSLGGVAPCGTNVDTDPERGQFVKYHDHWYWFDNLHSRLTGDFVTELLDIATGAEPGADGNAERKPQLLSYTIGYLSHFAADTVGHAYVNSITGGPYRLNQAQRHTTQEKVMDVWAYNRYYRNESGPDGLGDFELELTLKELDGDDDPDDEDIRIDEDGGRYYRSGEMVDSAMHRNFQFTIGEIDPRDWSPDQTELINFSRAKPINQALKLPDVIADNVAQAANRAYPSCYGPLTGAEVDASYRAWYKNFQSSTTAFSPAAPGDFPAADLTGPLQRDLQDLVEEGEDIPESIRNVVEALFDSDTTADLGDAAQCMRNVVENDFQTEDVDCLQGISESITNFITNLATAVADLFRQVAELAVELVDLMETLWATVNIRVWNFLLQKLYTALYSAYKANLMLICATGFGSMYSEDLQQSQLRNLWNPDARDASGRKPKNYIVDGEAAKFPRKGMKAGHTPTAAVEDRLTGLANQAHLVVPFGEDDAGIEDIVEMKQTVPGPTLYGTNTPEVFINDPNDEMPDEWPRQELIPNPERNGATLTNEPFELSTDVAVSQQSLQFRLSSDHYYASGGEDGDGTGGRSPFRRPVLGDAVSFTVALFERYRDPASANLDSGENPIPNLNLSGDRAIGFPTWANRKGCEKTDRTRWQQWNADEDGQVPWLVECEEDSQGNCKGERGIDSVFVPDPGEYY
jgi:hypothetical protein